MSIFHNAQSLNKRYVKAMSYSIWRIWLFKVLLLCMLLALIFTIVIPMLFSDVNITNLKVKELVNDSKGNEVYLTDMKYNDEDGETIIEATKAYTYTNETDIKNLENAKITKPSTGNTLTAENIKVEDKKNQYTATGKAKYIGEDIIINSDKAIYNKKSGNINAQGNLKIVIKE